MKKFMFAIFLILILSLIFSTNILSADLFWRLTHNDQYSLLLGQIKQIDGNLIDVHVYDVISGEEVDSEIKVEVNDFFMEKVNGLQEGDNVLLSIDKSVSDYSIKWGIFKVSSLDYKELKILSPSYHDNPSLEFYINSNGKYNDFIGVQDKLYVKDENGDSWEIYPNNNALHLLDDPQKITSTTIQYLGAAVLILILVFLYYRYKRNRR